MKTQKRLRDYGYTVGRLDPGERNAISDVSGVRVGHVTLKSGNIHTGVTAVVPHNGNLFTDKLLAAAHVINGFGKSVGLIQLDEMGTLETPVILTNTLNVGEAVSGLFDVMLEENPDIGRSTGTVNPVVLECNDGFLNDIRRRCVEPRHVAEALRGAGEEFEEGSVGAGTGMSCFGLKGGIGSSSRVIPYGGRNYTLGVLVLTNMGKTADLTISGDRLGERIAGQRSVPANQGPDGSIIVITATDLPLTERQLGRLARRCAVGLGRTGSFMDNGSGEIAVAFTTANRLPHSDAEFVASVRMINDACLDIGFRAAAEATEEAILNSMVTAKAVTGMDGHHRDSLADLLPPYRV